MPQIQGAQGCSCRLYRKSLGNAGDEVLSAFLQGKQNGGNSPVFIIPHTETTTLPANKRICQAIALFHPFFTILFALI
jgi:hypothetical protein